MALIQTPRLVRKLQRALRLTSLPDSVLAPETVAVILVEDLSAPLSDEERGCMGSANAAAVAAENGIMVLVRVGAPAEYDLVVTEAHFSSPTTQRIVIGLPTAGVTGLTVSGNTSFEDFSIPGRPSSQLGFDTQAGIPAHRILLAGLALANTLYRIPLSLRIGTIGDGNDLTSVMIAAGTANADLRAGFKWTEKAPQG